MVQSFIVSLSLEKTRTSPYLEKGSFKNRTAYIGQNISIACYELISGTLPDFRWLKWKIKPNVTILNKYIDQERVGVDNVLGLLRADQYHQIVKQTDRREESEKRLFGVELLLTNLTRQDTGWYTCLVSNHIGSDYITMYLDVKDKRGKNVIIIGVEPKCHNQNTFYRSCQVLENDHDQTVDMKVSKLHSVFSQRIFIFILQLRYHGVSGL